jgi:hypothetical protein
VVKNAKRYCCAKSTNAKEIAIRVSAILARRSIWLLVIAVRVRISLTVELFLSRAPKFVTSCLTVDIINAKTSVILGLATPVGRLPNYKKHAPVESMKLKC